MMASVCEAVLLVSSPVEEVAVVRHEDIGFGLMDVLEPSLDERGL